jgi:hypothetical protein
MKMFMYNKSFALSWLSVRRGSANRNALIKSRTDTCHRTNQEKGSDNEKNDQTTTMDSSFTPHKSGKSTVRRLREAL